MFAVEFRATMRSARLPPKIVVPQLPSRRERLVRLSREWNLSREAELQRQAAQAAAEIEARRAGQLLAYARREADKPAYLGIEPLPLSSPRQVITRVLGWHPGILVEDVTGKARKHPIIAARFDAIVAVYMNCRLGGRRYSLPELGRLFGGRDHTTILAALRKRGYRHLDQRQGTAR